MKARKHSYKEEFKKDIIVLIFEEIGLAEISK